MRAKHCVPDAKGKARDRDTGVKTARARCYFVETVAFSGI